MRTSPVARREFAWVALILVGLALPLLPIPGDALARMDVQFQRPGMSAPHAFSTRTLLSACSILAATLAFEDPKTGDFTRISCAR